LCYEIIVTTVNRAVKHRAYFTLSKKYSFSFLKVGNRAIDSHFSLSRPGPLTGPPFINPNRDNCELSLKFMKGW
jgi:hypothetical protein